MKDIIGRWAFVAGIVLSAVVGFLGMAPLIVTLMLLLGFIVGMLNITMKETVPFLVAIIALIVGFDALKDILRAVWDISSFIQVFYAITLFVVAAAIPVILRALVVTLKEV